MLLRRRITSEHHPLAFFSKNRLHHLPNNRSENLILYWSAWVGIFSQGTCNIGHILEIFTLLGDFEDFTVNDCIEHDLLTKDLVVTSECDDMFCYYNKQSIISYVIDVPCSLELDYEFQQQSE